jgi:hypothetical protein
VFWILQEKKAAAEWEPQQHPNRPIDFHVTEASGKERKRKEKKEIGTIGTRPE